MLRRWLAVSALFAIASPALAQQAAPLPSPEEAGSGFTVALGIGYTPDYVGSDDYRVIPAAAVRGTVGNVSFSTKSTYLYADVLPRPSRGIDFDLGPIAGVRRNRTGKIHDPVVRLLPDLKTAFEVGGFVGVSLHNITNPYDTLGFRVDVLHDVGSAHRSTVFSPNVDFSTPLSRHTYASASVGLDFVSNRYADYYFGITSAESALTGLPAFDADGGLQKWKAGILLNQSITGDLTGGLSVFGTANYSRLVGDSERSPIVSLRGSPNQWLLAAGLAYTF
ncbi:MAG TPA: MipA/OmpV family protein [Sphingomicrobium sp.]|nr:MipA/OmpV family protein [Sphingomicrobium sp.]